MAWIKQEYGPFEAPKLLSERAVEQATTSPLTYLHPTIQHAAGSLYATGHYRQALLDACIALDRAVQQKSQLTGSGTRLMETAFSPGNPVLKIGNSPDEQQGFLSLFRGAMLAIRNPKAHSLGGTHDAQRALEWLSFASVLLRNLDEATVQIPNTPNA
ncbi:TIGR02391 family protein [Hymenobacter sp. BT664]|uniref:TIGR02391 family protein n=1 Tax=Hymenobacter montanus TaxID=2771359 RepID=A0A927GJT4_9BACT|nr:TIGR02391 family protein [Hymenobacter montanus]MBD2768474.1 TIGR02391 family protein [Hymenobacter montanus]